MNEKVIKGKKLNNARDLGYIRTADGRRIKSGKLIRSGRISDLPKRSADKLQKMGVSTVVDFRIPAEKNEHPDTELKNSRYVWLPVTTTPTEKYFSDTTMYKTMKREGIRLKYDYAYDFDAYMIATYRSIVFSEEQQSRLREFFKILIEEDGCVLWHCNSGKDRAGICSMLVEALLGVDEETIYYDYLASKKFWRGKYRIYGIFLTVIPGRNSTKKILKCMMKLKKLYLQTVIEDMKAIYGGVVEYCKQALGISNADIAVLRKKYLI
ncbi:MAG: tyrosine-protein phosphatase [Clostridia bacterium]|nr:tyrosine-protein phosphatase [Clostridia bacterium]